MAGLRLLILSALFAFVAPAFASLTAFTGSAAAAQADAAAAGEPTAVVDRLHAALLDTMQNADALGVEGRYRALRPILEDVYDFRTMIAIVAGAHWASAGEDRQRALLDAFSRLSAATYADRFDGYDGETFEIEGTREGPRGTTLVDTRLNRSDGEPVAITYVLRPGRTPTGDQGWRIIDVLLEGSISELALRRSDYAGILAAGGVPRLTEVLDEKVAAMLSGEAS
jgi:phospholipid transport system substrate-binding protein